MPIKHQSDSFRQGGKYTCWKDCLLEEAKQTVKDIKAKGVKAFYRSIGQGEYRVFTDKDYKG